MEIPPEQKLFDELSLSDGSEFLEVEEETNLRKRLFPTPLLAEDDPLDESLVCILIFLI